MKHTIAVLSCAAVLAATLTACGGSDAKATLPASTGGTSPSATTTSPPTTTPPTPTNSGPVPLVPHATYTYGALKVVVDQPANIPKAARPSMRVLSEFLQGVGRTTARNRLDPSLTDLASTDVVKYIRTFVGPVSVQGIGTMIFTVTKIDSAGPNYTLVTGCVDQSKLVQVRKGGSHFIDDSTKKYPTLKMTVDINRGLRGPQVTRFAYAVGSC